MLHKITILTQEDDRDFIYAVYKNGAQINEDLYKKIADKTLQVGWF
jgi:hypothetical protein